MKRTFTGILAGLMVGAGVMVLTAGPAAAGDVCIGNATNAPDGRMRLAGGDWTGGGVYPQTVVDVSLADGQVQLWEMQWRNRGNDNLTVRVKLNDFFNNSGGYGMKFFVDGQNVSKRLRDNKSIGFLHLPPGKRTSTFVVQIRNKGGNGGFAADAELIGYYGGQPAPSAVCDGLFASVND